MAVMQNNYTTVTAYNGDKNQISVTLKESSNGLSKSYNATLSDECSREIADSIVSLIYDYLKDKGLLAGEDC